MRSKHSTIPGGWRGSLLTQRSQIQPPTCQVIAESDRVREIHEAAEVFDHKAETSFKYLQVGRVKHAPGLSQLLDVRVELGCLGGVLRQNTGTTNH